jgi:transcription elongation factor Elf1
MDTEDKCPKCGEEIIYDEVEIGVGLYRGNARCNNCGWTLDEEIEKMMNEV